LASRAAAARPELRLGFATAHWVAKSRFTPSSPRPLANASISMIYAFCGVRVSADT
jgi:hypothetical protein